MCCENGEGRAFPEVVKDPKPKKCPPWFEDSCQVLSSLIKTLNQCVLSLSAPVLQTVCVIIIKEKCELSNGHHEFNFPFTNGRLFLLKTFDVVFKMLLTSSLLVRKQRRLCADVLQVKVTWSVSRKSFRTLSAISQHPIQSIFIGLRETLCCWTDITQTNNLLLLFCSYLVCKVCFRNWCYALLSF